MHRVVVFDRENNHSNVVVCFIFGTLLFDEDDEYDGDFTLSQPFEAPELWYDLLAGNPIDLDETFFDREHPLHFPPDGSEPEPVNLLAEALAADAGVPLDVFGGDIPYADVLAWQAREDAS